MFSLYTLQCNFYCTMYIVQCTLYIVRVQCTLYSRSFVEEGPHLKSYNVWSFLCKKWNFSMLQVLFCNATFCKLTPGTSVPALYGNKKQLIKIEPHLVIAKWVGYSYIFWHGSCFCETYSIGN